LLDRNRLPHKSYSNEYNCPAGFVYDPTYGCTLSGDAYKPDIMRRIEATSAGTPA
jgi:hypothetical protein